MWDFAREEDEIVKCIRFSPIENKIVAGVGFYLKILKFEVDSH